MQTNRGQCQIFVFVSETFSDFQKKEDPGAEGQWTPARSLQTELTINQKGQTLVLVKSQQDKEVRSSSS